MVNQEEYFVDATEASQFLHCSRKHLLKLSILGKIPAHPLPGTDSLRTLPFQIGFDRWACTERRQLCI